MSNYFDGTDRNRRNIPHFGLQNDRIQPSTKALTEALANPLTEAKEYILWAIPKGETDALHAQPIYTQGKSMADVERVKGLAAKEGWHSFKVQTLDISEPFDAAQAFRKAINPPSRWRKPSGTKRESVEVNEAVTPSDGGDRKAASIRVKNDIGKQLSNTQHAMTQLKADFDKMVAAYARGDEAVARDLKSSCITYVESLKIWLDRLNGEFRAMWLEYMEPTAPIRGGTNPMQPSAPKKSAVPNHPVKVGDVWVATFGYDETHILFYVVTKVTTSGAYFAKCGKTNTGKSYGMFSTEVVPDPKVVVGEPKLSKIKMHGDMRYGKGMSANIDGQHAIPWDGKPKDERRGFH